MSGNNIYSSSSTCRYCGGRFHAFEDCPEIVKKKEAMRRYLVDYERWENTPVLYYEEPAPPPNLQDYQKLVNDEYEHGWDYSDYAPEMAPYSSDLDEYDDCYYEYSEPASMDRYECDQRSYYGCSNQELQSNQSSLDKIMRKVQMSKVEQELAQSHISREYRLKLLSFKYDILGHERQKDKSYIVLSTREKCQAKQEWIFSQVEEEVVEANTTPFPPVVEGSKIESTMAEEEVTSLPVQETDCLNLDEDMAPLEELVSLVIKTDPEPSSVLITPTNKVGDEGLRIKIRKVGLQDLGQVILKWTRNSSELYMPILVKHLWMWHVNYRAFIGNSVGKCSLRPP